MYASFPNNSPVLLQRREVVTSHCHGTMQQKFWMRTNRKSHLKVYSDYFKLHRSYSVSLKFGKSWRNFLWDCIYRYLSLEQESDNVCVLLTYSIMRAREIRKFYSFIDIAVQRRQRNVKDQRDVRAKLLFVNINILSFAVLLAFAVVVGFVVMRK